MKIILPSLAIAWLLTPLLGAQSLSPPANPQVDPGAATPSPPPVNGALNPMPATADPRFQLPEDAPAAASAVADSGDLFIERVVNAFGQHRSIAARVRYRVDLFDLQPPGTGTGIYLQQGSGDDRVFRLELKTVIGEQPITLEKVCDGRYLWQYQETPEKLNSDASDRPSVTRLDLARVRQAINQRPRDAHPLPTDFTLGGLPKLLDGLQHSFHFTTVEGGQLDSLPVWIATGTWRPAALEVVSKELADQAARGKPLNLGKLPTQLPEEVVLYVGQDDLFPYRIEFRRRAGKQGRGALWRDELRPILTAEFYELRIDTTIDSQQFVYQPANADILDLTSTFVKAIGVK